MSKRKAEVVGAASTYSSNVLSHHLCADLTGLEDEDEGVRARRLRARAAVAAAAPTSAASSEEDSSGESDSEAADRDAAASEEEDELVTSDSDAEVLVPASKKRKGAAAKAPSANKKAGARKAGASRGGKAAGASSLPVRAGAGGAAAPGRGRRLRKQSKSKLQLGEEEAGSDEDELDEMSAEEAAEKGAGSAFGVFDYSALALKPDHANRPLWVCPNGRVVLESFSPAYKAASDFLVAIAEPVCRPDAMHEYELTAHSLYAAVSVGLKTEEILAVLNRLSKTALPMEVCAFVRVSTQNYGKVKLVLQRNKFFLESAHPAVLRTLLADDVIAAARVAPEAAADGGAPLPDFDVADAPPELAAAELAAAARAGVDEAGGGGEGAGVPPAEDDDDRQLHSFEIDAAQVEHVKQRCLPSGLNYPTLEEYDFRADSVNPDCEGLELKAATVVRPYQEKSLTKMFGNGRARSGIIVLPCGAGKSLTGIAAASRIKKSVLCLCTSSVSVDQWRQQFKLWTQLPDASVVRFTSQMKEARPVLRGKKVSRVPADPAVRSRSLRVKPAWWCPRTA
jgi:DNA excision repair protein ERCC-3